jgi:hypothetical protein
MKLDFEHDDEKMEAQLRQFRPQEPQPLPHRAGKTPNQRRIQLAIFSAAAAILLAIILVAKTGKWKPENNAPVAGQISSETATLGQLRRLTDDPAQLDSQLDSLSRVLPDVHRQGGVLSKLAQESR